MIKIIEETVTIDYRGRTFKIVRLGNKSKWSLARTVDLYIEENISRTKKQDLISVIKDIIDKKRRVNNVTFNN